MLEILSWWSFIYRGKEGLFREDGNEMMDSQQSTCYSEPQKTPTKNLTKLKRKKKFSQLNTIKGKRLHKTLSKGTFTVWLLLHSAKQGLVYILVRYAWPHSITSASMRWQQTSADKLPWQKGVTVFCQLALGRGEFAKQNSSLWSRRVTKTGAPSSLLNSQLLSPAKLHWWGTGALFALPDRISHQMHLGQLTVGLDIQISVFPLICSSTTWVKTI